MLANKKSNEQATSQVDTSQPNPSQYIAHEHYINLSTNLKFDTGQPNPSQSIVHKHYIYRTKY
jgi:hypothetical protein